MTFKDVYFELKPFEANSDSDDPMDSRTDEQFRARIESNENKHDVRVKNDEWIEKMCHQDADQFLSSIQKKGKIARSPVCSRGKFNTDCVSNKVENRDPSRSRIYIHKSNEQRDVEENIVWRNIAMRENEEQELEFDPIFSPGERSKGPSSRIWDNNNYLSLTESSENRTSAPRNQFHISSTESSGSRIESKERLTSAQRNTYCISSTDGSGSHPSLPKSRYISSTDSNSRNVSFPNTDHSHARCQEMDVSTASSTKLILDDLSDLQSKMDIGVTEKHSVQSAEQTLCKFLWERQWGRATRRIQTHPEEAREKIKLHYLSTDLSNDKELLKIEASNDIRSALPLHLACAIRPLPPTSLLQELINAYPEACRQYEEDSGMLPIHMAANLRPFVQGGQLRSREESPVRTIFMDTGSIVADKGESTNHESVINLLLISNPESISAKETINGMTPLHIAASTTRAENGIVSPVASNVLNILMVVSPFDAVNCWKDNNGMTPYDWAWRNVDYFCPHCGIENAQSCINDKRDGVHNFVSSTSCKCPQFLSVSEMCLHPFLRKDIRSYLLDPPKLEIGQKGKAENPVLTTQTQKMKIKEESSLSESRDSEVAGYALGVQNEEAAISPLELNKIREFANTDMAFRKMNADTNEKTAMLHLKICLSELVHPSNHGRKRRGLRFSKNNVPNPFFEVFAAHRCGMSKSYYKSYPLRGTTEGTWEDAFLDLGLTHKQLKNGTNGASYIEVGIRVMHCPENGTKIKLIGTCQVSLETLERQQEDRLKLQNEVKNLRSMTGDTHMFLPEPEKYPVLKGFEVTGKLQVMSLKIE